MKEQALSVKCRALLKVYINIGWLIVRFAGVLVVLISLFCTIFNGTDVKWKYYLNRILSLW